MTSVRTTRIVLITAVVLVIVLFLLFGLWPTARKQAEPAAVDEQAQQEAHWWMPKLAQAPAPIAPTEQPDGKPIIDEVTAEKKVVCVGEENLITVRAHTPGHRDDAYLHTLVAGGHGVRVPVRAIPWGDMPPPILVFGKGPAVTSVPMPVFVVRDCGPQRGLVIRSREMMNAAETYELTAKIVQNPEPFTPTLYRWSFGDGDTTETSAPYVEHKYDPGREDRLYIDYLVTCEASSATGEKVVGRASLQMVNHEFANLDTRKVLALSIDLMPRFPEMAPSGVVTQHVRVRHHRKQPVIIDEAYRQVQGGAEERIHPAALLGTDEIPAQGVQATVQWDTSGSRASMVDYRLVGHDGEGHAAYGRFSVMKPTPTPTREASVPVNDPVRHAKILKARELLKKGFVSDEDLTHLQAAGAFTDLEVDRSLPPIPLPEPESKRAVGRSTVAR